MVQKLLLYLLLLLPISARAQIPLEVRIGGAAGAAGRFVVQDLGQYLSILYNYLIGVAGVLATVMIVVGGFRWLLAAGDPGKIGAAKETIGSAVIGLALALGSFLLLNTINPQLVELRLPYIPKVKQERFVYARRCSGLPGEERLFLAGDTRRPGETLTRRELVGSVSTSSYTLPKNQGTCGKDYYYTSGGTSLTCEGDTCPVGTGCVFTGGTFQCKPVVIKGKIFFTDSRGIATDLLGDFTDLMLLCADGDLEKVAEVTLDEVQGNPDSGTQNYSVIITKEELTDKLDCGTAGFKGLFIRTNALHEPLIAVLGVTAGGGETVDDKYAFGPKACTSAPKPYFFQSDPDDPSEERVNPFIPPSEGGIDWKQFATAEPAGSFWDPAELVAALSASGPITCDIETNLERFPAQ